MKKTHLILFIILSVLVFVPIRTHALTVSHSLSGTYGYDTACVGDDSLLGNPDDENSVAWLIHKILSYVTICGMILVVVLT